MSGAAAFSARTVRVIRERDGGACISCGTGNALQTQHILARGRGGVKDKDLARVLSQPWNGLTLCLWCHQWTETRPVDARVLGWTVRRSSVTTAELAEFVLTHNPVLALAGGVVGWRHLDRDGSWRPAVFEVDCGRSDRAMEVHPARELMREQVWAS